MVSKTQVFKGNCDATWEFPEGRGGEHIEPPSPFPSMQYNVHFGFYWCDRHSRFQGLVTDAQNKNLLSMSRKAATGSKLIWWLRLIVVCILDKNLLETSHFLWF